MPDSSGPSGAPNRPDKAQFGEAVERVKSAQGFDERLAAIIGERLPPGTATDPEIVEAVRRRVDPRLIEVLRDYLA